jgi:hypothetical protein
MVFFGAGVVGEGCCAESDSRGGSLEVETLMVAALA